LGEENKLKEFSNNAYQQAKKFDIHKILPHYERYYQTTIELSRDISVV
jgi:hypothetical protein